MVKIVSGSGRGRGNWTEGQKRGKGIEGGGWRAECFGSWSDHGRERNGLRPEGLNYRKLVRYGKTETPPRRRGFVGENGESAVEVTCR